MNRKVKVLPGPHCSFNHNLINKLCVIIGQCELLDKQVAEPECAERLHVILKTAHAMTGAIRGHHCPSCDQGARLAEGGLNADGLGDVYI